MHAEDKHAPVRRSTERVRSLLLDAAAQEFSERDYAATTMRSVAQRAGVSLSVLYRHFEKKEQLYLASLLNPFAAAFDQFAKEWRRQLSHGWADDQMVREFVADLHDHLSAHRRPLLQLLSLQDDPNPALAAAARGAFESAFLALTRMSDQEALVRGWPEPTISRTSVWLAIVTVVGQVVMEPWSPRDLLRPPGKEAAVGLDDVDLLTRLLLHGLRLEQSAAPD